MSDELTFDAVRGQNFTRCRRWHPGYPDDGWTGADWSNAVCGEAGEMANIVKKLRRLDTHAVGGAQRGGPSMTELPPAGDRERLMADLADEIADVFCYLDLLAMFYGIDLPAAIISKFNRVSERQGFPERLP